MSSQFQKWLIIQTRKYYGYRRCFGPFIAERGVRHGRYSALLHAMRKYGSKDYVLEVIPWGQTTQADRDEADEWRALGK